MDYYQASALTALAEAAGGAAKHASNAKYGVPEVRYITRVVKKTVVRNVCPSKCISIRDAKSNTTCAVVLTVIASVGLTLGAVKLVNHYRELKAKAGE